MPYIPFHFFKILFIALTICAQLVLYSIAFRFLAGTGAKKPLPRIYLAIIFILINTPLLFLHSDPRAFQQGFLRTYIMMPFYAYETFSVAVALAAFIFFTARLPFRLAKKIWNTRVHKDTRPQLSESRRAFLKKSALGLGAYTFVGSLHSIYTRDDYRIDRVSLSIKDLPPQLEDLTISMISDVHSGMYMPEDDMLKYTEAVNNLKADMIFIPGDFVTSQNSEILPLVKAFSGLKSKYGTYTCLGNHDFFANPDYITEKLREIGMKVLRNQTEELKINGSKLMLSGVDDGRHANFAKVVHEATSLNVPRILLCHKPYYFENAVAGQYDLMFSGHTHGGQIVLLDLLGMKVTPAALVSPYISGRYKLGESRMYVSRGIGTVGLPIRVNCPPEITLFTLKKRT